MDSVEEAFAARMVATDNWQPATAPSDDMGTEEGRTPQRIEALFQSQVAGIQTQKDDLTGTLLIRMSYDDFAAAVTSLGAQGQKNEAFLKTLASLLRTAQAGQPYRMDIFLQVDDNPASITRKQPQKMAVIMRDLGVLAQALEKAGLPQRLISVGMEKGQSGYVELLFRPHMSYQLDSKAAEE
jgi:hypothetical protein